MRSRLASIAFLLFVCLASHAIGRVERECVTFTHSYCNLFNYSTAIFPNPRGHETPEDAAKEFKDFNVLLGSNACHPKLGTLLCFIYFPVCNKTNFNPEMAITKGFFPCQDLCDEVHASNCTNIIETHVGSWPPHLQCNYTDRENRPYYRRANKLPNITNCIDGVAPLLVSAVNECARGTHSCDENAQCIDTQNSYICVCREGFVGNGTSCQDVDECSNGEHNCHHNAECTNTVGSYNCTCNTGYTGDGEECTQVCPLVECKTCKIRNKAVSKTFKNNCFCYAVHINVTSNSSVEECNHVYSVRVKEQFHLRTPYNSTYFTTAPTLAKNEEITIITRPSHCKTKCFELDLNKEYIIAGAYGQKDGSIQWYLEGNNNKALVSEWEHKYDKKMKRWIEDGNNSKDRSKCGPCE